MVMKTAKPGTWMHRSYFLKTHVTNVYFFLAVVAMYLSHGVHDKDLQEEKATFNTIKHKDKIFIYS